jgi:hypothetical protein
MIQAWQKVHVRVINVRDQGQVLAEGTTPGHCKPVTFGVTVNSSEHQTPSPPPKQGEKSANAATRSIFRRTSGCQQNTGWSHTLVLLHETTGRMSISNGVQEGDTSALCPAVWDSSRQGATYDWLHGTPHGTDVDNQHYAHQHPKMANDRMKAHYNCPANTAQYQGENQVWLYWSRPWGNHLICSHPGKALTRWSPQSIM